MILLIKSGDIMCILIYMVFLGIFVGFSVKVYQESGHRYFFSTFVSSLLLLPALYITIFFGTILAVYFAKKKKEYLIDILFKYAPKFGIKLDEKKNLTKEAISKYWMRLCLYFIFKLWTSLDTISCAVIAGLADTFRERQPFTELQDVLRSELNNKLGEMFRFIDKRLAKEGV